MAATIAEINETLDRVARYDEEAARRNEELRELLAESVRRDAEYKAAAEKRDAEWKAEYKAILAENARRDAEYKAERKAELAERDRRMEAESKKTEKAIRKLGDQFNSQWGRFVEALCANQVIPLLNSRGIEVHHTSPRVKRELPKGGQYEIDILAVNGDTIVAFEVKTTLRPEDVDHFAAKLGVIREMFSEYKNYRVLGGMAYLRDDSFAAQNAQKCGLFTILATGNGATITNDESFAPKEW
ncbi:MAG: hypothetical protein ACRC46_06725 [Thermoguttaceae bacterium]